ncbi:MAG: ABC transporter permease subunit [Phycisphaerales bacterium]|nr:ABC transporter permease subunit [Phycisphaerales bacterium]
MTALAAIAKREWGTYFRTSIGWVVIALYLLLCGIWISASTIRPGEPSTLRVFFTMSQALLLMVAPAISMKLISEELRTGTIEPLMTSPVSDWHIIVGKYIGGLLFLLTMFAPTLLYVALLEVIAAPDYGPILSGYLGLFLLGMLYVAVGLFMSSLTENQIVSFLATLFFFLLVWFITSRGAQYIGPPLDQRLYALSPYTRIDDFAKGVIDTGHIVFFLAASAWFVVAAVITLESRRWR